MIENKITCDICKKEIGQISTDETEHHLIGDGMIVASNYPNYITMKMCGHGELGGIDRTYDICESCLTDFIIRIHKHYFFRKLIVERFKEDKE